MKNYGLKRLRTFKLQDVQEMMTSEEWTRATFVREPKERILSAFLNKFVESKHYFRYNCCNKQDMPLRIHREECRNRQEKADFRYFLHMAKFCLDPHWKPQSEIIDLKWWPHISFIGNLQHHNAGSEAKILLKSIRSSKDNLTAWEKFGSTGWGINGTDPFMSSPSASLHPTDARAKLRKYYTKCDELFVEKFATRDYTFSYFHFDKIRMFNRSDNEEHEDLLQCGLL